MNTIENVEPNLAQKHLNYLGYRVVDRVTGFSGVVSSVCFDLYGCIQVAVNPPVNVDGKVQDSHWFDIRRLNIISEEPVMEQPNFQYGTQAEGKQGPSEKPKQCSIHKPKTV